jgi:hypothetical protein
MGVEENHDNYLISKRRLLDGLVTLVRSYRDVMKMRGFEPL